MIVKECLTTSINYRNFAIKYDESRFSSITRCKLDYEKNGIMDIEDKHKGRCSHV